MAMLSGLSVLRGFLFIWLWEDCYRFIQCHQNIQMSLQSLGGCGMLQLATQNFTVLLLQGSYLCTVGTVSPEDALAFCKLRNTKLEIGNWSSYYYCKWADMFKRGRRKPNMCGVFSGRDPKNLIHSPQKSYHRLNQPFPTQEISNNSLRHREKERKW